jgi:vesicle-fusing ATPase
LDEVLAQVKRRIWVPLAAPPILLQELGISPVRGLLLYGMPGCGKTLIARTIGRILSPVRPVTVVSGPELMDKFVGSSEQNVRKVFDSPPPIYDHVRIHEVDDGKALSTVALHVIIMDEFDAMARTRGGKAGSGVQGDAGVARDSVVNQILAKMDGVDPLPVPTLVIGMTNKRSLIDPALLRPGRFEVRSLLCGGVCMRLLAHQFYACRYKLRFLLRGRKNSE